MNGRRSYNIQLGILLSLMVFFGLLLNIVLKNSDFLRVDLGSGAITSLDQKTIDTLSILVSEVKVTYYTSEKKRMPTAMKNMEGDIRSLLNAMSTRTRNFSYQVIYPEDTPQVARSLGRFRISSFQYKTILKDEYSVNTVWSGMLIEYKGQSRAIPYITAGHLPYIEDRVINHVSNIDTGYKPNVAVYASSDFSGLRGMIANLNFGVVKDFEFNKDESLPLDADMAFIVQPEYIENKDVENIKSFMKDGKDVFVSLSSYYIEEEGGSKFRAVPRKSGFEDFLLDLGVKFERKILMEERNLNGVPFFVMVDGRHVVLDGFVLQRCGTMFVPIISPVSVDAAKLKKNGYTSDTLIFSSNQAWTVPFGENGVSINAKDLSAAHGNNPKIENIAVVLTSDKPWEGRLFLFGSAYMFSDSASNSGANQLYLKNILMTFAKPENLSSIRASSDIKPQVPPMKAVSRFFWRFIVIFLVPSVGFLLLLFKVMKFHLLSEVARRFDMRLAGVFLAGTIAVFLVVFGIKAADNISFDLTEGRVNSLSPVTLEWMKNFNEKVNIYYFSSPANEMPIYSKKMVADVTSKLRAIAKSSKGKLKVFYEPVSSETLSDGELKKKLDKFGIKPFKTKIIENDRYVEKMIYSGLAFEKNDGFEAVPSMTLQNSSRLEFVTVSALKRLIEKKRPEVALIADLPHLTAGEFWELQQIEVQLQPKSEDVYASLIKKLRNEGYKVNVYDSKTVKNIKEQVLIYIQPWTISETLKEEINSFLVSGRNILLAVQHYRMQVRKYSGRAYDLAYWPQPQFTRVNELLEPYGIELIDELFLDQSKATMDTSEQIRWGAYKKKDKRSPDAQPFIIRAIPANFDNLSPITSNLSDVLFIWGNRWQTIKGKFPDSLNWRPLILSSPVCWPYSWKGGFLTAEILKKGEYLDVRQPLSVMVEGSFTPLEKTSGSGVEKTTGKEAKLLLVGSSKFFENEQIDTTRYDHEKFILNAVADLAYGTDLARIQASGGAYAKGFSFVEPGKKMMWRLIVLCFSPLIILLYGLYCSRIFKSRRSLHL